VVTILAFAVAPIGVMSEIYTACVTPVFPLTPSTTTSFALAVPLGGPVSGRLFGDIGVGLLSEGCLGLEGSLKDTLKIRVHSVWGDTVSYVAGGRLRGCSHYTWWGIGIISCVGLGGILFL